MEPFWVDGKFVDPVAELADEDRAVDDAEHDVLEPE